MKRNIFVLFMALVLSGCLTSTHPLPDSGETKADSPLAGYWFRAVESDEGQKAYETLTVFPSEKMSGHLAVIDSLGRVFEPSQAVEAQATEDTDVYDFILSKVGGRTFVNFQDRSDDQKRYMILKYVYDGQDGLEVSNISDDFLTAAAKDHPAWFKDGSGSSSLTLEGDELTAFIASLTDKDFDEPIAYTRWTKDAAALRQMVQP